MQRFDNPYLMPTDIIDSDHPRVRRYAREILGARPLNPIQKATRLYYAVRDDGRKDSIFHAYNNEKQLFMEYIEYHGSHITIPVKKIVAAYKKAYGEDRVLSWIDQLEKLEDWQKRKFGEEEVLL